MRKAQGQAGERIAGEGPTEESGIIHGRPLPVNRP